MCPWPSRGKEGCNWVHASLRAAGEEMSPPGKSECWAGKITDPHYNNERSPVPSQMSSPVTFQWVVSAYSHILHTQPSEAEPELRRTLSPSLSPHTRTTSSFDSLHTSLLSYPPEHDLYGNLFHCLVRTSTPSRPTSRTLSSASAAMHFNTHPTPTHGKQRTLSTLSPSLLTEQVRPTTVQILYTILKPFANICLFENAEFYKSEGEKFSRQTV